MVTRNQDDHALNALKRAAQKASKAISDQLLADLYAIQREHQFDVDRAIVVEKLVKRIVAEIEAGNAPAEGE